MFVLRRWHQEDRRAKRPGHSYGEEGMEAVQAGENYSMSYRNRERSHHSIPIQCLEFASVLRRQTKPNRDLLSASRES
jgi:hypothetical protein